jgi:ribosome biogenesis GTPase
VVTDAGVIQAGIAGHFHAAPTVDRPVVGDWVLVRAEGNGTALIRAVWPRRSLLRRVAAGGQDGDQGVAANVDTVFIVGGLDGDHQPRRLRRYLALVRGCGAEPVLVLNKADQAGDPTSALAGLAGIDPHIPVHLVSARQGTGLAALVRYLVPGRTIALLGSSGVGKSTLINRLLGSDRLATGVVREDDSRGRHTTTWRELIPHPSGAVIMDTPGMRELALCGDGSDLDAGFHDLASFAVGCRFADCSHHGEPGCAVRAAIDRGDLPAEQLAEYLKLEREAFIDGERRHERRARMRRFGQMVREVKEFKRHKRF